MIKKILLIGLSLFFANTHCFSQKNEIGFLNKKIQKMVNSVCKTQDCDIISVPYFESKDPFADVECDSFFYELIPYAVSDSRFLRRDCEVHDGEVLVIIDNKIKFVVLRDWVSNNYVIRSDTDKIKSYNSFAQLMIKNNLKNAFKVYNRDISKYYALINGEMKSYNPGDSEFKNCKD